MERRRNRFAIGEGTLALTLAAAVLLGHGEARVCQAQEGVPPSILVVLIDDLGIEYLDAYGIGEDPPPTPNIDQFAAEGLVFESFWATPMCSSTRAAILTGRHGHRTGIGRGIPVTDPVAFSLEEETIPEILRNVGYATAAFGKWHLGEDVQGDDTPRLHGFDHYEGALRHLNLGAGQGQLYTEYHWTDDGGTELLEGYMATRLVDATIDWISGATEPWFVWLAPISIHWPYVCPPENLRTLSCVEEDDDLTKVRAMTEALDTELGRLFAAIPAETTVFLISDNGSSEGVRLPPTTPGRVKPTTFEGGIRVPMMVKGPGVTPGLMSQSVMGVDLHPTILELGGALPLATLDGLSLVPVLSDPEADLGRPVVFAEIFEPNGPPGTPRSSFELAASDGRWKLRITSELQFQFYDLETDPWETVPRGRNDQPEAFDELKAYLLEIHSSWF